MFNRIVSNKGKAKKKLLLKTKPFNKVADFYPDVDYTSSTKFIYITKLNNHVYIISSYH